MFKDTGVFIANFEHVTADWEKIFSQKQNCSRSPIKITKELSIRKKNAGVIKKCWWFFVKIRIYYVFSKRLFLWEAHSAQWNMYFMEFLCWNVLVFNWSSIVGIFLRRFWLFHKKWRALKQSKQIQQMVSQDLYLYQYFLWGISEFNLSSTKPQNGQSHSNISPATADELFQCVWPFCRVGA